MKLCAYLELGPAFSLLTLLFSSSFISMVVMHSSKYSSNNLAALIFNTVGSILPNGTDMPRIG